MKNSFFYVAIRKDYALISFERYVNLGWWELDLKHKQHIWINLIPLKYLFKIMLLSTYKHPYFTRFEASCCSNQIQTALIVIPVALIKQWIFCPRDLKQMLQSIFLHYMYIFITFIFPLFDSVGNFPVEAKDLKHYLSRRSHKAVYKGHFLQISSSHASTVFSWWLP